MPGRAGGGCFCGVGSQLWVGSPVGEAGEPCTTPHLMYACFLCFLDGCLAGHDGCIAAFAKRLKGGPDRRKGHGSCFGLSGLNRYATPILCMFLMLWHRLLARPASLPWHRPMISTCILRLTWRVPSACVLASTCALRCESC